MAISLVFMIVILSFSAILGTKHLHGAHRFGNRADSNASRKGDDDVSLRNGLLAVFAGLTLLVLPPMSSHGADAQTEKTSPTTTEMPARGKDGEARLLSEATARELDVGGGQLALVLAVDVNGQITAFKPRGVSEEPLKFPVGVKTVEEIRTNTLMFYVSNPHICVGSIHGGSATKFCPNHP